MGKKKKTTKKKHTKKKAANKKVAKSKHTKPKRGMMLVHRTALAGAARVTADGPNRYAIDGVRIDEQKGGGYSVEATDGRRLIRIEGQSDDVSDFPVVKNAGEFKAVTVPKAAVQAAVRATTKRKTMPILENVAVMQGAAGSVRLVSTDLTTTSDNQTDPTEGAWPPFNATWPKGEPVAVVGFNARLLEELLRGIRDASPGHDSSVVVKLEVFSPTKPIRLSTHNERHNVTALLMPCHLG